MYKNVEVVIKNYSGLSTETKPTSATGGNIPNGSRWREVDTGKTYHFDKQTDAWYLTGITMQGTFDGVLVNDSHSRQLLESILLELRIMNTHLSMITDNEINEGDVDHDY